MSCVYRTICPEFPFSILKIMTINAEDVFTHCSGVRDRDSEGVGDDLQFRDLRRRCFRQRLTVRILDPEDRRGQKADKSLPLLIGVLVLHFPYRRNQDEKCFTSFDDMTSDLLPTADSLWHRLVPARAVKKRLLGLLFRRVNCSESVSLS
jgi:hypothetical protein